MTDQLGRVETYAYYTGSEITLTTGDNLKSITDRKGQVTTFNEYDSMNRVKKITYHDSSFTDYTYDLAGRVDYINDSVSGFIDYTYNDFGCTTCSGRGMDRIAQEVTPLGTIDYTYDNVGRRKTMQVAGQPIVNYDYYNNGWLENIRQIISGTEQKFNFTYDDGGRRQRLKSFNGASLVTETIYGFDNANRLLNLEHLNPLNQILESIGYTYDPNGNRITMNRPSVTLPLPNQASNTSYNEANQMLSFNDKNIVYDNNGNMTSVTNTCGTTNYTWDVRNRLTGINGFNTNCSPLTANFKYDALGRRIEKTINGVTTQYLYDGFDIIQEKQNGTVTANYIRTLNIDEPLTRIKADGTVRHYVMDALGSVIALTDDTGVVKTTYSYDPFGNTTVSGESSDNPFQYIGRENDGTGLYYYRARYYSPELQRFISEDPIGFEGGDVNLFAYSLNNPITFYDPNGLDPRGWPNPYPSHTRNSTYSPSLDNPVLRCHVATHNNPVENLIGAAIVGGPLVALMAPEVVPVIVRAAYTVSANVLANPQTVQNVAEFAEGFVTPGPPSTPSWPGYWGGIAGGAYQSLRTQNTSLKPKP